MMSKVMETEYIMHIKGTDPYPKGDIQRLARDFQFYSTATRIMADFRENDQKKKKKASISRGLYFSLFCFTKALFTCLSSFLLIRKLWFNVKQHQGHIFVQEL